MRKLLIAMLLLLMATCFAFAEGEPAEGEGADPADQNTEEPFDIGKVSMSLKQTVFYKTGSEIKPSSDLIVLKYDSEPLDAETFPYELQYSNCKNVGKATVTAVFDETLFEEGVSQGDRSVSASYEIVPAKPKAAPIQSVKSVKPNVVVSWNSVSCTGYQLQMSTKSNYSNPTSYKQKATSKSIGKLKNAKLARIPYPGSIYFVQDAERDYYQSLNPYLDQFTHRHNDGGNFECFDGHVLWQKHAHVRSLGSRFANTPFDAFNKNLLYK